MNKVKCAECGLLGMRLLESRELVETESRTRESGWLPKAGTVPLSGSGMFRSEITSVDDHPVCIARIADFRKEMGREVDVDTRRKVLNVERECEKFVPWQAGFTPKEHSQMLQQKELLAWQQKREDDAMRFQAEQARLAHVRHIQSLVAGIISTLIAAAIGAAAVAVFGG